MVALQKGSPTRPDATECATQLYRAELTASGQVRSFNRLGHALAGYVYALAANKGASTVAYALWARPCAKGSPGALGVLDTATGRTHQWSDVGMYGVTTGSVGMAGGLSLTANGRELVLPVSVSRSNGAASASEVIRLPTGAPAGTVARRSTVLLRHPGYRVAYQAAVIGPRGRSLYVCAERSGPTVASDREQLLAYHTGSSGPHALDARRVRNDEPADRHGCGVVDAIATLATPPTVRPASAADRAGVERLPTDSWGSATVVIRGAAHDAASLPAFLAVRGGALVGLATYRLEGEACELVSLHATERHHGVSSALLARVAEHARNQGARRLWLGSRRSAAARSCTRGIGSWSSPTERRVRPGRASSCRGAC